MRNPIMNVLCYCPVCNKNRLQKVGTIDHKGKRSIYTVCIHCGSERIWEMEIENDNDVIERLKFRIMGYNIMLGYSDGKPYKED